MGPAFAAAGLKTKVLLFDHNYNYDNNGPQQDYPLHIFEDPEANRYAAGSAWHNYGGDPSVLDGVHARFPDKDIYFTEASIGTWNYSFEDCLINDFRDIFLGTLGRWGRGVTLWNLMLDYQGKPFRPRGCSTCYGASSGIHIITTLRTARRSCSPAPSAWGPRAIRARASAARCTATRTAPTPPCC